MKVVFKKWVPETREYESQTSTFKENPLMKALLSTLQTINKDLDEHLNKDNENNENFKQGARSSTTN